MQVLVAGLAVFVGDRSRAVEVDQATLRSTIEVEEVVVTAQKRAENLQDVPISMQAFTGEQLQNAGAAKLTDIARLAPNLNVVVQNSLSRHLVIRGVGTNEFFGNAPSSVGMYMDEVTMNTSYMSTLGLFDMKRVEVLRGPQNSLFGRNTTGGAVNYITNLPTVGRAVEGFGLLTYGANNLVEGEGGMSLPVGSAAALRLASIYSSRDGVWNNLDTNDSSYGDEERYSGRATLVWEPSAQLRVTANLHSARSDAEAQPQKVLGGLTPSSILRINDLAAFTGNIDWRRGVANIAANAQTVNIEGFDNSTQRWQDVYVGGSGRNELRVDGGYLKIGYDFGAVMLTSITAYDKTHGFYEEDNTGNGNVRGADAPGVTHDVLIIDMDQSYKQFSQELRLSSNDDEAAFRWIGGLYYFDETSLLAQAIRFGNNGFPGAHPSGVGITPPSLFDVIPNPYTNTVAFSIADLEDKSYSVYGQTDFRLSPTLNLSVGLRYTRDEKSNPTYYAGAFSKGLNWDPSIFLSDGTLQRLAADLPACVSKSDPSYIPFQRCAGTDTSRQDLTEEQVGGKVGLQYYFADDIMAYGGYSRGFKSGKFDVEFLHTPDTPFPSRPLDPETLDTFELGLKSTLLDRTLVVNGAVFYSIWENQQVFNVGRNGPEFFNLPESKIRGAELETSWLPARGWLLSANLGFLDTELTDVTGIDFDLGQGDFQRGRELPLSPKLTANAGIERSFDLVGGIGSGGTLTLRTDWRYQSTSKVKFSPQPPIDEYDSRSELGARATFVFGGKQQYELSLFGNNLTSEKYCSDIQDLRGVSGSFYCLPNEGEANFGMQAKVGF
jgi:iron complex outermembrane receptor protein